MKPSTKLKLIDGVFNEDEAKEVLLTIFNAKIRYHERKVFENEIRFGMQDLSSVARMESLKSDVERFLNLLNLAKKQNRSLVISSEIHISLKPESVKNVRGKKIGDSHQA